MDPDDRTPLRAQLWERFKALASRLKEDRSNENGCYIAMNEEPSHSNVFFRVERGGAQRTGVALTVGPAVTGRTSLVFRVHTVTIVEGAVHIAPAGVLPVSYDPGRTQFSIETVPPIEEAQMAEFFLARAERLLNDLQPRHVIEPSR